MTYVTIFQEPKAIGTAGQTLVLSYATGSFGYTGWGTSIPTTYNVLTSNVSTAGTGVSVPCVGMSFAFVSAGKYMIDGCFLVQTATATTGVQFALDTDNGVSIAAIAGLTQLANTGTGTFCHGYGDGRYVGTMSGLPAKDTPYPVMIKGMVIANATEKGNVTLRIKPETGTDIVQLLAGSMLIITKIA